MMPWGHDADDSDGCLMMSFGHVDDDGCLMSFGHDGDNIMMMMIALVT